MRDYKVKTIRALDRGLEVLAYLHQVRAASLHDLHLATGLPKATLTRVILTLEKRGMVWQRLADSAYIASHTLQPRAPQLSDENYLVEVASPVMVEMVGPIGFRINMLRSATGRAYIAFCSESERQAMLQRLAASSEPGNFSGRAPCRSGTTATLPARPPVNACSRPVDEMSQRP